MLIFGCVAEMLAKICVLTLSFIKQTGKQISFEQSPERQMGVESVFGEHVS